MERPRTTLRNLLLGALMLTAGGVVLVAQEGTAQEPAPSSAAPSAAAPSSAAPSAAAIEPVFPEENPGLVFVEGEEAVSTNFAPEPTLNFGCSGYRTLQLSRLSGQQGGRAFSATYVFYLEQGGRYELWYGGTPPGPEDELFPSYSSPFSYRLDGGEERPVYREDVAVVQQYAPAYYWIRVGELDLEAGAHTLDFLVSQPRRHDNRYYFYLDAFFLLRADTARSVREGPLPEHFPGDLGDRSIDFPFRPLEDYEIAIRDNPGSVEAYLQIAEIYALLGDYLSGLRYLKRAELIAPEDPRVKLLLAKTRIWKGEVGEGLKSYRELLLLEPERPERWLEAGKVAAWTGRYEDSVAFLRSALERFPGDLGLSVNLGLTFLWSGRLEEAEEQFRRAQSLAEKEYRLVLELARVYAVNGYPERSIPVLRGALRSYFDRLEPYLLLEKIYREKNDEAGAADIRQIIAQTFRSSGRLTSYLELFRSKQALRDEVIADYERQMRQDPENLPLRELLAQTYFWNGQRRQAIAEYRRLLANHAFQEVTGMDAESLQVLILLDRAALHRRFMDGLPGVLKAVRSRLSARLASFSAADKANQSHLDRVAAAREKGEEPPALKGEDPADRLEKERAMLARVLESAEELAGIAESLLAAQEQDRERLAGIESTEQEIAESFARVVDPIRWQWNRREFLSEFASLDSILADYVLGRIALSEGRLGEAEGLFRSDGREEAVPAEFLVGLFESLLWQGRSDEALALARSGPAAGGTGADPEADAEAGHRPAHWDDLLGLGQAIDSVEDMAARDEPVDTRGSRARLADAQGRVEGMLARLQELGDAAARAGGLLAEHRRALEGIYGDRIVRAMYRFEENTYLIRNELGGYYLREQDYQAAIRQFRQVLSVDPWNVDAVYRLGKVYEWNGDWSQAMKNYRKVYYTDPSYEDVTAQYNRLAREHADSLEFAASSVADTSTFENRAEASFTHPLNSLIGLRFRYAASQNRTYQGSRSPANYLVQTVSLGVPFALASGRLQLTPVAGGQLISDLYGQMGDAPELLVEPLAGLEVAASLGAYVYLRGGYRWQREEDSLAPVSGTLPSSRLFSHFGELNLNASLAFIPVYPLRNGSLRTYGSVELLTEGWEVRNLAWAAAQELTLGILRLKEPTIDLSLVGNLVLEDAAREEPTLYYAPQGTLLATGGLSFSAWLGVGEFSSVNLALRAAAGTYQERLFLATGDPVRRTQIELDGGLGFTRGDAYYYLRGAFSANGRIWLSAGEEPTVDYRSLSLTLGFSTSLPRLLAP